MYIDLLEDIIRAGVPIVVRKLRTDAVTNTTTQTQVIAAESLIPDWRPRNYNTADTPIGTPVRSDGQVWRLLQQHDATEQDWRPETTRALWEPLHTTDPALAKPFVAPLGTSGMYRRGECCIWDGKVYRAVMDTTYTPGEYAAAWEEVTE